MHSTRSKLVLFSGSVGVQGHGRRLFRELSTRLARTLDVEIVAAIPEDRSLEAELEEHGVRILRLSQDYSTLNADRYRAFGSLAPVARGMQRLRLGFQATTELLRQLSVEQDAASRIVVHFLDYEYLALVRALRILESRSNVSSVVTVHPSDFRRRLDSPAGVYKNMVRGLLRPRLERVSAITCHGEWIADRLREQFDLDTSLIPIHYPSEGTDLRRPKGAARRATGCLPDKKVLLWFGMIRRNKRLDVALSILHHLPEDYVLLVAGKPSEVSGEQVRRWIDDFGVEARTITHLDYIAEEDVPDFFSAADALIATHDESFSSASGPVADARSYRLPVLSSGAGQLADYIERFGVGLAYPTQDPVTFAHEADEFLSSELRLAEVRDNIDLAAERLSWDAFAKRHARLYQELLSAP